MKKGLKIVEFLGNRSIVLVIVRNLGEGPFHKLHDNFVKLLQMPDDVKYAGTLIDMFPERSVITSPAE